MTRMHLYDMTPDQMKELLSEVGEKPYRAGQIMTWAYGKYVTSFDQMTDLPQELRDYLKQRIDIQRLRLLRVQEEENGAAKKYLWGQDDMPLVESVLLKYKYGLTGCVSTQAGCPVGCAFCASKVKGFQRNLTCGEIIESFLGMARDAGQRIGHLVFMGTGEPFLNYEEVLAVIDALSRKDTYGMSRRRMTVSTVGIPDRIRDFIKDGGGVRLALSLHATTDETRSMLIPYNKVYPIGEIMGALREYSSQTGQRVTIEYMLLSGVNDSKDDARRLSNLVRGIDCLVNLIPWNPVAGFSFAPPSSQKVGEFRSLLERNHIKVTLRRKLGGDIEAACGQLRRKMLDN